MAAGGKPVDGSLEKIPNIVRPTHSGLAFLILAAPIAPAYSSTLTSHCILYSGRDARPKPRALPAEDPMTLGPGERGMPSREAIGGGNARLPALTGDPHAVVFRQVSPYLPASGVWGEKQLLHHNCCGLQNHRTNRYVPHKSTRSELSSPRDPAFYFSFCLA